MAKEDNILRKALNFLQSESQGPLMPPIDDISRFFTQYGRQSPLESSLGPARDQFEGLAQARGLTRTEPEMIPGAEPTAIPRMDPFAFSMPVGLGSWQNIPANKLEAWYRAKVTPASMRTLTERMEQQEIEQAREQMAIKVLIAQNPDYFKGVTAESFKTAKDARDHMEKEKKLELARNKAEQQQAKADAAAKTRADKDTLFAPKPPTGLEKAPVTGATFKF